MLMVLPPRLCRIILIYFWDQNNIERLLLHRRWWVHWPLEANIVRQRPQTIKGPIEIRATSTNEVSMFLQTWQAHHLSVFVEWKFLFFGKDSIYLQLLFAFTVHRTNMWQSINTKTSTIRTRPNTMECGLCRIFGIKNNDDWREK